MNETNQTDRFAPLFAELDRRLAGDAPVCLAIEGGSASGKTTLGKILAERYDCTVFHMDDFFLRPEQRTAARFAEPGGNVDRERFLAEVLLPLRRGENVFYRRFDCACMQLQNAVEIAPKKLTVIEGAYSTHPELAPYCDLSVFLDISPELQRERISRRNTPEKAKRFFAEWIPMEQAYFAAFDIPAKCTLRLSIEQGTAMAYKYIALRSRPVLRERAAAWFHEKWRVPEEAYFKCMTAYLTGETEYGWYLCLDGERIVGGLGVIANDYHDRPDLTPNICAVYTEPEYRGRGIAGRLLNMAADDLAAKGIPTVYLVTDHTGFYERYGWKYLCPVQCDGEDAPSRMYVHHMERLFEHTRNTRPI